MNNEKHVNYLFSVLNGRWMAVKGFTILGVSEAITSFPLFSLFNNQIDDLTKRTAVISKIAKKYSEFIGIVIS